MPEKPSECPKKLRLSKSKRVLLYYKHAVIWLNQPDAQVL